MPGSISQCRRCQVISSDSMLNNWSLMWNPEASRFQQPKHLMWTYLEMWSMCNLEIQWYQSVPVLFLEPRFFFLRAVLQQQIRRISQRNAWTRLSGTCKTWSQKPMVLRSLAWWMVNWFESYLRVFSKLGTLKSQGF